MFLNFNISCRSIGSFVLGQLDLNCICLHKPNDHLSVSLTVCMSFCVLVHICLSVSLHLSIFLCLPSLCICLYLRLSFSVRVCLSLCMSIRLSVSLFWPLAVFFSPSVCQCPLAVFIFHRSAIVLPVPSLTLLRFTVVRFARVPAVDCFPLTQHFGSTVRAKNVFT